MSNKSNEQDLEPQITSQNIEHAEQLIGIEFTPDEREQMREMSDSRRSSYEQIRSDVIDNSVPPALVFEPRSVSTNKPDAYEAQPILMSEIGEVQRPDNLEDIAFYPLTHLAQLIRTQQVTSLEMTELYLERLKYYNRWLECVITFTEDLAMAQAKQADEEIAAGHYRGPLHGIPWGAKDLLAVPGYKTTWGAAPYRKQFLDSKATVVQRLEDAGAVLIAKLTLGALAYGDVWFDGKTKNPWNLEEGSSGSSAGSASAVAAGLVGFAIGTETYGSIVSPATRCGVTGLRPTFGRVSRHGAMALSWSMDKIGPIVRSVEDAALVFNAIHGEDGLDNHAISAPFEWNPNQPLSDLKIGYLKSAFEEESEQSRADEAVLDSLESLGVDLIEFDIPQFNYDALDIILVAEAAAAFDEITRDNLDDQMQWQDDEAWPNTFRQARFIPAVEYIQANRIRSRAMRAWDIAMQKVDVFVTPTFGGDVLLATNLTGHPSVVVPNGFNESGGKTSISFVGGLFQDAETLRVAKAYQDATDFHLQHPPLDYESLD